MTDKELINIEHTNDGTNEIDLRQLLFIFITKWYFFLISVVILMFAGNIYLKMQPPVYESKASVLIKQEQSSPEEMFLLADIGMSMGKNNIDNEIGVFKSPDLISKIITSLELYTTYRRTNRFGFHTPELYRESPLYVRMEDVEPERIPGTISFIFDPSGQGFNIEATYMLGGSKMNKSVRIDTLPGFIELPVGRFYVARNRDFAFGTTPLQVTIQNPLQLARSYVGKINIAATTRQSSLLEITFKTENRRRGEDFVQSLIAEYNQDAIKDKNTVAYNTSVFIEERLKNIASELGEVEYRVEEFRREYEVADIPTQVGSYLRQSESYDSRRMEIETQLNLITFIEDFIKNPQNSNKLVPNLGIKDPGLVTLITEYNNLLIDRERIESATSPDNPAFKQRNQQVLNLSQNIITSLANEKQASQIALRDLEREHTITSSRIRAVPTVDRRYTDILRQQEVKSNLFVYLLQKREESNLTQAAVAPKAKIIAKPHSGSYPIAPRKPIIYALFFIAGLIIPWIILFLKDYFRTQIEGMKDLEGLTNCNVIGDIIKTDQPEGGTVIAVKQGDDTVFSEMVRTTRNNLLFMTHQRDQNVILVTSSMPKEGKTFISVNLAKSLALMDKKVLLIGGDLRNPKLSRSVGIPRRDFGFSSFLAGHLQNYNELIEKVDANFYVMQTGPVPPNPNELLSNTILEEFFKNIRTEFDYVVVDSAPVGIVSDTFFLAKYASATVFVIKENYSEKDTVKFLNNLIADKRLRNVGVVLNEASTVNSMGMYKYKYGYKYAYKYRYGYAQGYGKES